MWLCKRDLSRECDGKYRDCTDCVLDKIRAEIEELPKTYPFVNHYDRYVKEDDVKKIIDKYMTEGSEE